MRLLLASTSLLSLPTYKALQGSDHNILGLIIKHERPSGRGQENSVNALALKLAEDGIPIYRVKDHEDLRGLLSEINVDVVIAISFGMLVKPDSLKLPKHGWINMHFSLLPKYRGAAPVQRAILAGEKVTGLSIFQLDEGMDTGPIFREKEISIAGRNSGELLEALSQQGAAEVLAALESIENGVAPQPQLGEPSLAPKIRSSETRLDFSEAAERVARKVAAFAPTPGAWCEFQGRRIKIFSVKTVDVKGGPSGICLSLNPLVVGCGEGALEIDELQEAGKRRMSSQEWVRGARIDAASKFS